MKLYHVYKKPFNLLILMILLVFPVVFSYAQNAQDLQTKINQKDADIAKLEEEIKIYQAELDNLEKQKSSLSGSIKQLDVTKKKLNADISVTQKKIDKTNLKIQNLSSDISNKQDVIINHIESIKLEIKKTNEFEQKNLIQTLLSETDFTAIWTDIDNIATVREKIREDIIKLKQIKGELEDTRKETINAKNELVVLKSKLSDQQKIVVHNTNEKSKLLKETKNSEANYQKLLKTQLVKKEAFEK